VSVASLMPFLDSPVSTLYAQVCERYGVDPARDFEDDDVLAFNLRAALALKSPPEIDTVEDAENKVITDLEQRMKAMG